MNEPGLSHLVRAVLAIGLTFSLPVLLYVHTTQSPDLAQVYRDALAAVVAFYFGATSTPRKPKA
jgi:Sec-independent protein secretion pathway component TatC